MTAATINAKIAKGYAKVGKKLGIPMKQYRADSYFLPVADRNEIGTLTVAWSKDEAFKQNPEPTLDYFTLYVNYTQLQVGDILESEEAGRTFAVAEINLLRGAVAFQCNRKLSIFRTVYTPAADKKTDLAEIILGLPCAVESVGAASNSGALGTVGSSMSSGQSQVEVWTVTKPGTLKLNDVLEIDGNKYLINGLDTVGYATKIKAISTKAGK